MGLFSAIKNGLAKTRDALLGELKGIVGAGKITDETLEELEEHLIKADVGVEAAFLLTDALRENALGKSLTTEQVLDIMRNEAERLLKDPPPFELKGKPHVVLVIGVNGAGKTTTIGKLAARWKAEGKKVMIAACDTFRAAAIDQLETWAQRSGAEFVKHQEGSDPAAVARNAAYYDFYSRTVADDIIRLFRYLKISSKVRRELEAAYLEAAKVPRTNADELYDVLEKRIATRLKPWAVMAE